MGRPRVFTEPQVAINVRITESSVANLDRLVAEMQAATTAKISRTHALRRILDEHFAARALAHSGGEPRL
jgi:hypothetical protein